MKNVKLKLAVLGTLSFAAAQAMALGFINLPIGGSAVASGGAGSHQPTGGTTAYILCNTTGNYGSGSGASATVNATAGANNTCAIVPAPATNLTTPDAAYTLVTSATRTVTITNTYTGGVAKNVGSVTDVVWRKPAATAPVTATPMCIYGAQFTANLTDYNSATGNQYFEANDIARGGFSGLTTDVAYAHISATSDAVYRIGRTFTAVQHRATVPGSGTFAPGYYNLPLTTPAFSLSINGVDSWPLTVPTAAQQSASLDGNWVDFTTDVNSRDDDGSTKAAGAMLYVKAACTTAAPVAVANAIRLRQTFQEQSTDGANPAVDQRFIEVSVSGFVPPGGTAAPAPVVPF